MDMTGGAELREGFAAIQVSFSERPDGAALSTPILKLLRPGRGLSLIGPSPPNVLSGR